MDTAHMIKVFVLSFLKEQFLCCCTARLVAPDPGWTRVALVGHVHPIHLPWFHCGLKNAYLVHTMRPATLRRLL